MSIFPAPLRMTYYDFNLQWGVNCLYTDPAETSGHLAQLYITASAASLGHLSLVTWETALIGPDVAPGTSGPYGTARDIVVMQFAFADGTVGECTIPCPKTGCFQTDGVTVDPAGVLSNFIANVILYCYSSTGSHVTSFVSGWRDKVPIF